MAGTTNFYGISYPTSTDYVKDGATAMQTIATGFDSVVAIPTYNNQTGTSYTFVLADTGKVVTANNASAVTFTIPPQSSVTWTANTSLRVTNLGAGALSIAGGSGVTVTNSSATVAQYSSATVVRTGSDAWTVVPAGSPSGLTLLRTTTITTQSQVDFTSIFNSTYRNYRIIFNSTAASTTQDLQMQFLSGTTPSTGSYYRAYRGLTESGSSADSSGGPFGNVFLGANAAFRANFIFDLYGINLAQETSGFVNITAATAALYSMTGGIWHLASTAYDGFRLLVSTGTFSGVVRVYGYQN